MRRPSLPALPARPSRRRVLVVLDEADADRLQYEGWGELGSRSDVAVVNADDEVDQDAPVLSHLERRGLLVPGNILVQNPYRTERYEVASADAGDQFAIEKFAIFSHLCQRLGARRVTASALANSRTGQTIDLEAEAGKGPLKIGARGELDRLEKLATKLQWKDTYGGSSPDLRAARELLVVHALDHDTALSSLIDAREYSANPHRERELTVDLSAESNKNIKAALELKIPAYLSGMGKFTRSNSALTNYSVSYKVAFGA